MPSYTTRYLTNEEYKEWDTLVLQSPNYSIFDTLLWLGTISSVLKCNIKFLGVFKNNNLVGGIAINVTERFGIKIAKTPYMCNFNSCHYIPRKTLIKSKQERHIHSVITSISERLQNDYHSIVITNHPELKDVRGFRLKDWRQNILYSYRVCLRKVDFSLIPPTKRRQIKKAKKNRIVTEEVNGVKSTYSIINRTYVRQNKKCPLTFDELSEIYKIINDDIIILAAREQEKERYIAVYVSLIDKKKNCVYGLFNGYDTEFADSGANSLLLWEAIEYFRDNEFEFFDTGEALMPSKANFKSEFSADLVPYYQVSKSNLLFKLLWHFTRGKIAQR